jgi:hypothetical protein
MKFGKMILLASAIAIIASPCAFADSTDAGHQKGFISDPGGFVKTRSGALFQWADPARTLTAGKATAINKVHDLNCAASAGCVVFVQATVQIGVQTSNENQWSICATVDGVKTDPIECFEGVTSTTTIVQGVYHGNLAVKKGTHRIKIVVTSQKLALLFDWHMAAQMLE